MVTGDSAATTAKSPETKRHQWWRPSPAVDPRVLLRAGAGAEVAHATADRVLQDVVVPAEVHVGLGLRAPRRMLSRSVVSRARGKAAARRLTLCRIGSKISTSFAVSPCS